MTDTQVLAPSLRRGFAAALQIRRAQLGLTQSELADAMEVKRAYLGALESCKVNVSIETVQRFRDLLWPDAPPLNLRQAIGKKIVQVRTGLLTQELLSDKTHFSVPFISAVERGLSNTSLDQIDTLAAALSFNVLQWMGQEWFAFSKIQMDEWLTVISNALAITPSQRMLRKTVCDDLKLLRKGVGMTQDQLAEAIGVTKSRISQIERSKSNITLETLEQIVVAIVQRKSAKQSMSFVVRVGAKISELRKQQHYTQNKLGELSGLGRATIARIERADEATSVDQLEQVSRALGLEPKTFIEGLYPKPSPDAPGVKHPFSLAVDSLRKSKAP